MPIPYLIIVDRDGHQRRNVVVSKDLVLVGRHNDADIILDDRHVSKRHLTIEATETSALITDLISSNGTKLNGASIEGNTPTPISHGDILSIGPFTLTYSAEIHLENADTAKPNGAAVSAHGTHTTEWDFGSDMGHYKPPTPPIGRSNMVPPNKGMSSYLDFLPTIFHPFKDENATIQNDFMARYLQIMEAIWEPCEWRQDHIDYYFDPSTAPIELLPWLAGWVDVEFDSRWPEGRQRSFLKTAVGEYRQRGTEKALKNLIESATGCSAVIVDDPNIPFLFHVGITLPNDGSVTEDLIHHLIQTHKPACSAYILRVAND